MLLKPIILSSVVSGAHALTTRRSTCGFTISTFGSITGSVGQYESGQTKAGIAGTGVTSSNFVIDGSAITDSQDRGCWWTPPATVLQCDVGQIPEEGFSIDCNGGISYNGQTTFYQCATSEAGVSMIYLQPEGSNCGEITLTASGCQTSSSCNQSSSSAVSVTTYPATSETVTSQVSTTYPVESATTAPELSSTSAPSISQGTTGYEGGSCVPETTTVYVTISNSYTECSLPSSGVPGIPEISSTPGIPGTVPTGETGTETEQYPTVTPSVETTATTPGYTASTTAPGQSTSVPGTETAPLPSTSSAPPATYSSIQVSKGSTIPGTYVPSQSTVVSIPGTSTYPKQSATTVSTTITTRVSTATGGYSVSTYPGQSSQISVPGYPTSIASTTTGATTQSSSTTSSALPNGSCPGTLSGDYQYPHLILPVDSANADTAYGTSYFGEITSTISTVFNFDIPTSYSGKTCSLIFLFPNKGTMETSDFTFSGSGAAVVSELSGTVNTTLTYNTVPTASETFDQITLAPGIAYTISSFSCPAGSSLAYELSSASGGDTSFRYFQDWNPCPIGMYITTS
ncbi:ubiquitin 3 binding protein But2 C-terminal domain-containing protein [Whalleya microplaca]|nr:ubiquitin 3 binding protein But2 C-terminal domain-containing protein [Whalleya microplaca]